MISNSKKTIENLMEESKPEQRDSILKEFSRKVVSHVVNMNFSIPYTAIKHFNDHGNLSDVKEIFEPSRDVLKQSKFTQTLAEQKKVQSDKPDAPKLISR